MNFRSFQAVGFLVLISFVIFASTIEECQKRSFKREAKRYKSFVYRSYQGSIYCNASLNIQTPESIAELLNLVHKAISSRKTIKVVGSRHSLTDIICTNGIPISLKHFNQFHDNNDGTASFGAGIQLYDALQHLHKRNKTFIHMPAYGGITIGGAIGTGAHGSSLVHPTTLSDLVTRLRIIDGMGNIRNITDKDEINAFRVHLGLLGIITEVTLAIVPLFKVRVETSLESESILFSGTALSMAESYDWFQMWWFPSTKNVVVLKGIYLRDQMSDTEGNATSNFIPSVDPFIIAAGHMAYEALQGTKNRHGLLELEKFTEISMHSEVVGKPPLFSEDGVKMKNPAVGYVWKLLSNNCSNHCPWDNGDASILPEESAMGMHMDKLPRVTQSIRKILNIAPAAFAMVGIFIRFTKASSALMGIAAGRATVTLEWTTPMRTNPFQEPRDGIGTYQAILQTMMYDYGGRAHWGKNGLAYFSPERISRSSPNLLAFKNHIKTFDPKGLFLNAFANRLLNTSAEINMDPNVKHCALQDYCICSKHLDCGLFQSCVKLNDYNVCRDFSEVKTKHDFDPANFTSILSGMGLEF